MYTTVKEPWMFSQSLEKCKWEYNEEALHAQKDAEKFKDSDFLDLTEKWYSISFPF